MEHVPIALVEFPANMAEALASVQALDRSVVGDKWAVFKDTEGSPFGLSGVGEL